MENKVNIQDIKNVIKKLSLINSVVENWEYNPFMPDPNELLQLQSDLEVILNSYLDTLHKLHTTQDILLLEMENNCTELNTPARRSGKNAPAYRSDIDENLIYRLWMKNVPLREIAKQAGCSPNTVKSRILNMTTK